MIECSKIDKVVKCNNAERYCKINRPKLQFTYAAPEAAIAGDEGYMSPPPNIPTGGRHALYPPPKKFSEKSMIRCQYRTYAY